MTPGWEQFKAQIQDVDHASEVLHQHDQLLQTKVQRNNVTLRQLAIDKEQFELEKEEIASKLNSWDQKKMRAMSGASPSDTDDSLRPTKRRRMTHSDATRTEPTPRQSEEDIIINPEHEETVPEDSSRDKEPDSQMEKLYDGSTKRSFKKIHGRFPTVLQIDGIWVEIACRECGATGGQRGFFGNLGAVRHHHGKAHPGIEVEGLSFCTKRVVSKHDVKKMKQGEQPEVPILHRWYPKRKGKQQE